MKGLGGFLEQLRGKRSLREVAEVSGLSHTYIRNLELGINPSTKGPLKPSPGTLNKLAKAYNFPYQELLKKAGYSYKVISNIDVFPLDTIVLYQNEPIFKLNREMDPNELRIELIEKLPQLNLIGDLKLYFDESGPSVYIWGLDSSGNDQEKIYVTRLSTEEKTYDIFGEEVINESALDNLDIMTLLDREVIKMNGCILTSEEKEKIKNVLLAIFPEKRN